MSWLTFHSWKYCAVFLIISMTKQCFAVNYPRFFIRLKGKITSCVCILKLPLMLNSILCRLGTDVRTLDVRWTLWRFIFFSPHNRPCTEHKKNCFRLFNGSHGTFVVKYFEKIDPGSRHPSTLFMIFLCHHSIQYLEKKMTWLFKNRNRRTSSCSFYVRQGTSWWIVLLYS